MIYKIICYICDLNDSKTYDYGNSKRYSSNDRQFRECQFLYPPW